MAQTRISFVLAAALALVLPSCKGEKGDPGDPGDPGTQGAQGETGDPGPSASAFGSIGGTVKDYYGNLVAGAKVAVVIGSDTVSAVADASGKYTLTLAPGSRTVQFTATGYTAYSQAIEIVSAKSITLDARLNPSGPFAVTAARTDTKSPLLPGDEVSLRAQTLTFAPEMQAKPASYLWKQIAGPAVVFDDATSATPKITLASPAAFKTYLVETFATPFYKVSGDEPLVAIDRYQVVPINYDAAISKGNTVTFKVTSSVAGRTASANVSVAVKIPAVPSTGLASVPLSQPVILQGQFPFKMPDGSYVFPQKTSWSWEVRGPAGAVTVNDAQTAYPDFKPTAAGTYDVFEGGVKRFSVYAADHTGVMVGPGKVDPTCAACHKEGGYAAPKFDDWLATGHREVIFAGIAEALPDGHYAASCTPCHTVGIGLTGTGGYADAAAAEKVDYSMLQGDTNAEADFWSLYPKSAKLAGIQCENCHGNTSQHALRGADPSSGSARVSYSSNTCATCHARAPRHGRFPQWAKSGHASYATFTFNSAEDGTLSAGCAACHSAQGFKAYRTAMGSATWTGNRNDTKLPADLRLTNAEPITCVACHDPHDEGEESRAEWSQLARVGPTEGATYMLPAGFAAVGVGKGALCISCHNSRNGFSSGPYLHEDGDPKFGVVTSYSAPHEAAQGDVLLGRNAYWMGTELYNSPQTRSKHSYITDTCVTCHMELTTLDPALSMEGQTRHDFTATTDVCNKCHTAYSAEALQATFDAKMAQLKSTVGQAIVRLKYNDGALLPAGTKVTAVLVANRSGQVDVTMTGAGGSYTRRWFIGTRRNATTGVLSPVDAYLADPYAPGQLVQGCTGTVESATCVGFLDGAPGVTALVGAGQDATVTASGALLGMNPVIGKALWNTVLVQDDASRGIHNPSFSFKVMDATIGHVSGFTK